MQENFRCIQYETFAGDRLSVVKTALLSCERVENTFGKEENAS